MVLPANPQELEWDADKDGGETNSEDARSHRPCNEEIMAEEMDKFLGLMRPTGPTRDHAFGPQLKEWAVEGVPVDCGED